METPLEQTIHREGDEQCAGAASGVEIVHMKWGHMMTSRIREYHNISFRFWAAEQEAFQGIRPVPCW
jgi:hypothetical protein